MFSALARFFHRKRRGKVVVIRRDVTRITVSEWRSTRENVSMAAQTLAKPDVRILLDVVRNSSPANDVFAVLDNLPARAVLQARTEGYMMALNNIDLLGKFEEPKPELESEFLDPTLAEEEEQPA